MIDTTLMGPGFLVFFQHNGITSGGYEPHYAYQDHPWAYKAKREDEPALKIIEQVAQKAIQTQVDPKKGLRTALAASQMAHKDQLELILRLRLQAKDIAFKVKYLEWLIEQQQFHRQQEEVFLLLLH